VFNGGHEALLTPARRAWVAPSGWNNEFYVLFRSWNASCRGPVTSGGGYAAIGSTTIDGVVFA